MTFEILRQPTRLVGAALLATTALSGIASAQETATVAPVAAQGADSDAAGPDQLADITVVARKRSENVQSVPIPITVITPAELSRQNLVNFTDFQTKFPAFSVYLTNPKQLNLGVRGIGNNGFNTDGIDGSVGIFVDGVYTGRQGMVSTDFTDLADVELLRGPQGTLFGKNTTAGAVIINTLKPSFDFAANAEATVGNQGYKEVKGGATGALIPDKLALRLSGYYSQTDGNYRNLYNNGYQNARQGQGVRAQLLATPTENLSVRLIGTYNHQAFPTISPVILQVFDPTLLKARMAAAGYTLTTSNARDRQINIDGALNAVTDTRAVSGEVNWTLGGSTLTSITAFEHWKCFTNNDNDYTQLNAIPDYGSCNDEHQLSQELRFATARNKPLELTVGGFLSRQKLQVDSRIRFGDQYNIWAANPSATLFPAVGGRTWAQGAYAARLAGLGFASLATFHTDTEAAFANATWHPDAARRLAIDGGLRYTWEHRTEVYDGVVSSNLGGFSTAQINALSPSGANAQLGHVDDRLNDRSLSGEASVSYKVTPAAMLYAKYARGNKSAGFNLLPVNASNPDASVLRAVTLYGAGQQVKGETTDNFEIGLKSEWFDRHLLLNLTGFHTKVRNYQANESVGVGNTAAKFLANVGSLTSDGVELEGELFLFKGLHMKGFGAYNHAYYSSFRNSTCPATTTATVCDLTGRQVAWAPKWTADLTTDYSHAIGDDMVGYGLVDVNWRSKQNTTITLDPTAEIRPYALVSARVGLQLDHGRFDLQIWSENLFNKTYFINLLGLTKSTGIVQGYPGSPRTFGGTVKVKY
ncbi:TonB-dependent receptor [Sphingomonas glacialis]|uniref:TonB-dependent receptor n=1 Tax=Sphingomonas glacialis TaxID=658225 RepID=A0A502FRB1_9SPHN|nr:TonB-dependent receptor [Sphingomonas glacialis]TPG51985.1 TonB-dependent receptor [Sphingomonas glacialis]